MIILKIFVCAIVQITRRYRSKGAFCDIWTRYAHFRFSSHALVLQVEQPIREISLIPLSCSVTDSTCWIVWRGANRGPTCASSVGRSTKTKVTDVQPATGKWPTVTLVCKLNISMIAFYLKLLCLSKTSQRQQHGGSFVKMLLHFCPSWTIDLSESI